MLFIYLISIGCKLPSNIYVLKTTKSINIYIDKILMNVIFDIQRYNLSANPNHHIHGSLSRSLACMASFMNPRGLCVVSMCRRYPRRWGFLSRSFSSSLSPENVM